MCIYTIKAAISVSSRYQKIEKCNEVHKQLLVWAQGLKNVVDSEIGKKFGAVFRVFP